MKIVYLDTETTGLDPVKHDIVQLSGMIEINGKLEHEFNYEIQPWSYENIDPAALAISGRKIDDLRAYSSPKEAHKDFLDDLELYVDKYNPEDKYMVIGYNVYFDLQFLSQFFLKAGDSYFGSWFNWHYVDPLRLLHYLEYRGELRLRDYKLATVCAHFDIPLKAHDAMSDIRATKVLLDKVNSLFSYATNQIKTAQLQTV